MANTPLSVFMHPRTFWSLKYSGISRYVCELSAGLIKMGVDVHIPIKDTINELLLHADFFEKTAGETLNAPLSVRALSKILSCTRLRERARRFELRHQSLRFMNSRRVDIIHPTDNNAVEIIPYIGKTPLVITVHDMIHELYPDGFAPGDPSSERKRLFANRADRIIAISECTKNDLVRLFDISPEKIDVIHHGNSLVLPKDVDVMEMPLPERYVLYVGGRNTYKNFTRFAEAFAVIASQYADIRLICAGGGAFTPEETALLQSLGIADRCEQRWVSDVELAILYNRSLFFIYPSEYEGFGLPLLEAYECGAPVLCSRASCFPEVAGKGALYFNPCDIQEMAAIMKQAVESADLRAHLRQEGKTRLADFSWQKTAEKTMETYLKVVK